MSGRFIPPKDFLVVKMENATLGFFPFHMHLLSFVFSCVKNLDWIGMGKHLKWYSILGRVCILNAAIFPTQESCVFCMFCKSLLTRSKRWG